MILDADQKAALAAPLNAAHVKTREQSGRKLSYVEGWWAISEANRIFGFDGWSRETLELKCVSEREREVGRDKAKGWGVTYTARVRVSVGPLIREGSGTGHGIDRDLGQAHESALKEAETDAMKRALMTFGNPFGLALYDKEQNGVEHDTPAAKPVTPPAPQNRAAQWAEKAKDEVKAIRDRVGMAAWMKANRATLDKLQNTDKALYNAVNLVIALRNDELESLVNA